MSGESKGGAHLIDLTGRQFGFWTVLHRQGTARTGAVMWLCRCTCGNEKAVVGASLKKGESTSCGCTRAEHLTGRRFGEWRVIERGPNRTRRTDGRPVVMWRCACDCGREGLVTTSQLTRGISKSCGHKRPVVTTGEDRKRLGPGRILTRAGYIAIYVSGRGSRPEHRLVMERVIGRLLKGNETVHHINGNRSDNRPENLELWSSMRQPPRQRVSDLIREAKRILSIYDPAALGINRNGRKSGPMPLKSIESFGEGGA
jgi:hypothetical protein